MGLFDRTTDAFERRVDRLLTDLEAPDESLDYTYERLKDELQRIDEALVDLVTQRKRLEGERDRLEDRVDTHNDRARRAVEAGDDARAREHLETKRSDMERLDDVEARIADLRDAESEVKSRRNELRERIERFRTERAELTARQRAANAEAAVADALGREGEEGYADRRVADANDHVEESEARAAALDELRSEGFFEDDAPAADEEDLERARIDAEVESELDTLRSRYRDDPPDAGEADGETLDESAPAEDAPEEGASATDTDDADDPDTDSPDER
ncbi:PspA/IM30 family protein [Halomarina oriensis]|uniref:PspA/IM30 family protein n=1 Tax=Halomarina oriensis TaxID=671145 RepID=A0A6B0GQ52_9EURY|nr:PspA/IM30 family protein [Halomarina oriensis]MWG36924.1 PspA/IM30 family protein [Halomarina oriensis]